jgi:hypothetical protein
MKQEQSPFPPGWWGTSLEIAGLQDQRPSVGTYGCYEFASLPALPVRLDGSFGWLDAAPAHERNIGEEQSAGNPESLARLIERCRAEGVSLPPPFLTFMQAPARHARIRSNTDCFLDVADGPVRSPVGDGVLILFLSDSQGCVFWYLYIPTGSTDHAVVSSTDLYHPSGETLSDEGPDPRRLVFSAESFEAFLYRFWIENEIWFAGYEGKPISEEGRRYVDLYLGAARD